MDTPKFCPIDASENSENIFTKTDDVYERAKSVH